MKVYQPEPRVPFYPEKEPLNRRVYRGVKQALGGCLRGVGELIAGLLDALSPLIGGLLSVAVFLGIFFGLLSLCTSRESTQPAGTPEASAVHGEHARAKTHHAHTRAKAHQAASLASAIDERNSNDEPNESGLARPGARPADD